MYDFTVTKLGRAYLKELLQKPSIDINEIQRRQANVKFLFDVLAKYGKPFQDEIKKCLKKHTWFEKELFGSVKQSGSFTQQNWAKIKLSCLSFGSLEAIF